VRVGHAPLRRAVVGLLAIEAVQIAVGITQARLGLPEVLVGIHMVLACVLIALVTLTLLSMRGSRTTEAVAASEYEFASASR
jgi:cytochrome c oxidase assembly protein subunit 15